MCIRDSYYKDDYEFLVTDKDDLDFTDRQAVLDCARAFHPNLIIHAGAIAVTDFCNQHPEVARKVNVDGALHVAEAAREARAQLIFLSSEQVFNGNTNGGPFREEDEAVPNTVYGANKLEAEALLKEILDELWIVRFTWMFGLPERNKNMSNGILWDTLTKLDVYKRQDRLCRYPLFCGLIGGGPHVHQVIRVVDQQIHPSMLAFYHTLFFHLDQILSDRLI